MKATGIVRRIDDLGRVVIPKEIRKTMNISRGAQLEIFTDAGGSVIFRKYSTLAEYEKTARALADVLAHTAGCDVAVCDRESVLGASGHWRKELCGKRVSPELSSLMEKRSVGETDGAFVSEEEKGVTAYVAPVSASSEVIGCVAAIARPGTDFEIPAIDAAAQTLGLLFEEN